MKKIICIILILSAVLLSGCDQKKTEPSDTVLFYYAHNEIDYGTTSGVITSTVADLKNVPKDYRKILEKYFNGPTNYDCISPFPAGIALEDLQISNDKAEILLSPHMATLSGTSMTVALACLTRTVIELTGVTTVQIRILNNTINGSDSVTLALNSFLYWDDSLTETTS